MGLNRRQLFLYVLLFPLVFCFFAGAQDTTELSKTNFSIGGGMDIYYGRDLTDKTTTDIPFYVSSSVLNSIDVNMAWLDIHLTSEDFSFHFVPAIGSYMSKNYKNEPIHFQIPVEASISYSIDRKRWKRLEAGILNSPITNETPFSKDQLVYTRSLASENVPYYLCGLKSKFKISNSLSSFIYVVNGWQEIANPNKRIAFIHQLEWKPSIKNLLNWNFYVGNEKGNISNPSQEYRYFSDVFYTYNLEGKLSFTACAFYGIQRLNNSSKSYVNWCQFNSALRYRIRKDYALAMRAEYFNDPSGLILTNNLNAAEIIGLTLNITKSFDHTLFRLEGKYLSDIDGRKLFLSGSSTPNYSQKYFIHLNWTTFF